MRCIVVLAALAIKAGVFGQICEEKCEATCQQKCTKECQLPTTTGRPSMRSEGEICWNDESCKGPLTCVYRLGTAARCRETCSVDNDCLVYENGTNKCCAVGSRCVMKDDAVGCRCARSSECPGKMYCEDGSCREAQEVVYCRLDCHGPVPGKPDQIRPGDIVNITYSCKFIRKGENGHMKLKADIKLDKTKRLGKVKGESPQKFGGFVTKKVKKGEFVASLDAIMKPCSSNKFNCHDNRKCTLDTEQ